MLDAFSLSERETHQIARGAARGSRGESAHHLHSSAGADITRYAPLGSLNNRNLFSRNSGGWKCETNVLIGLVSSEAFSPPRSGWASAPCVLTGSSLRVSVLFL